MQEKARCRGSLNLNTGCGECESCAEQMRETLVGLCHILEDDYSKTRPNYDITVDDSDYAVMRGAYEAQRRIDKRDSR